MNNAYTWCVRCHGGRRASPVGLSDSDFRTCSVSELLGLASATLLVRIICSLGTRSQLVKRIIVRCSLRLGVKVNYCSFQNQLGSWEILFVGLRTSQLFGIWGLHNVQHAAAVPPHHQFGNLHISSRRQNELLFVFDPVGRQLRTELIFLKKN